MKFEPALIQGRLIKRYKRFLADVTLDDGRQITAHVANTGAMTGCAPEGARVWLSVSDNPKRKYPHSWQLIELESSDQGAGALVCVNTGLTNTLVHEALLAQRIEELKGFSDCQAEVPYGKEKSRIDFLLQINGQAVYVEVKHVTLSESSGVASFPDAVTIRGQKHIRELIQQVKSGYRGVLLFIIMRTDVNLVTPADHIDAEYGRLLREAVREGVEVIAYTTQIDSSELVIGKAVTVSL